MTSSPPTSSPMVWVTVGKTQHAAFLLKANDKDHNHNNNNNGNTNGEQQSYVQWATTYTKAWVSSDCIQRELSPRRHCTKSIGRRRRRRRCCSSDDSTFPNDVAVSSFESSASSRKRRRTAAAITAEEESPIATTKRFHAALTVISQKETSSSPLSRDVNASTNQVVSLHGNVASNNSDLPSCCDAPAPALNEQKMNEHNGECSTIDDDDDDDDEVEFVRTIPAPSRLEMTTLSTKEDAKSKKKVQTREADDTAAIAMEISALPSSQPAAITHDNSFGVASPIGTTAVADKDSPTIREDGGLLDNEEGSSDGPSSSSDTQKHGAAEAMQSVAKVHDDENAADKKQTPAPTSFPLLTSAYLQNLAEISYIILEDARWRVHGRQQQALFRWEDGDDLSAVTALKRLYCPNNNIAKTKASANAVSASCTCIMCRPLYHNNVGACAEDGPANEPMSTEPINDDTLTLMKEEGDYDDDNVQWLYTYARLYHRRGPWFRLDDIYDRYYFRPIQQQRQRQQQWETSALEDDGDDDAKITASSTDAGKENQSQPRNGPSSTTSRASSRPCLVVDESLLHSLQDLVEKLLRDLARLLEAGLVRGFDGEEECGKTVGVSLLTQPMRATVLSKLGKKGAAQKKKNANTKSRRENEIWKQMRQQRSIFACLAGKSQEKQFLPVCKHVDEVVLDKLVLDILKTCCGVEATYHLPVALVRSRGAALKAWIRQKACDLGLRKVLSCLCLREAPTHTLRRCCRLFLCVNSGPGEMRSDDTNGWKSLHALPATTSPPLAMKVRPPGLQLWYQVSYPGSAHRFGILSANFMNAFELLPVSPGSVMRSAYEQTLMLTQVFHCREAFLGWEFVVELRANVDYLIELNDVVRSEKRRQMRQQDEDDIDAVADVGRGDSVDFLDLLTDNGLDCALQKLISPYWSGSNSNWMDDLRLRVSKMWSQMEPALKTEWERILGVIAALAMQILDSRNSTISETELSNMEQRPWLRHLWWDGCLAYILWDIIPILERRELYVSATQALEVLLTGSLNRSSDSTSGNDDTTSRLAPLLLSRRARGKAYDRLVIDYKHMSRAEMRAKDRSCQKEFASEASSTAMRYCETVLGRVVHSAFIAFSSIRCLARRLKRPLLTTLKDHYCLEAKELGLRLDNLDYSAPASSVVQDNNTAKQQYSDWTPTTDRAVANAIASDMNGAGSRCVFIGHTDESLNVEQLAMECYQTGRLPSMNDDETPSDVHGGWVGWHDEGGTVRALFRIICGGPILGMDWGCAYRDMDETSLISQRTIHLSPYQGAPFDLHVGFELRELQTKTPGQAYGQASPGFYFRRRGRIEKFLTQLAALTPQQVCRLVHQSIGDRVRFAIQRGHKDPSMERDMNNSRTLSLVAAGCGGKQLAAIFRCLLFDYRHWSGGLPDLLLVRAFQSKPGDSITLVDMPEWIGESFSHEKQAEMAAQRALAMIADEEFLGCSKVGDSGGGQGRFSQGGTRSRMVRSTNTHPSQTAQKVITMNDLAPELELSYRDYPVIPECMMVEVKSSNDRLDPRQEDWLNILDLHGQARVCKFEEKKAKKKKPPPPSSSSSNITPKSAN